MKKRKLQSKLTLAALSLLVSIAFATSTTYAWFTTNSRVTVTDINMEATTFGELYIKAGAGAQAGFTGGVANGFDTALTFTDFDDVVLAPVTISDKDNGLTFTSINQTIDSEKNVFKQTISLASTEQYNVSLDKLTVTDNGTASTVDSPENYFFPAAENSDMYIIEFDGNSLSYTTDGKTNTTIEGASPAKVTLAEEELTITYDGTTITNIETNGDGEVVLKGKTIEGSIQNTTRVAFYNNTTKKVVVLNPYSAKGYERFENINLAQRLYEIETETTIKGDNKETVPAVAFTGENQDLVTLTQVGENYGAELDVYLWIEGTDADTFDAVKAKEFLFGFTLEGIIKTDDVALPLD